MRWLKRQLRNWLNSDDTETVYASNKISRLSVRDSHELDGEPMRFSVFRANGGTIVQTQIYDRVKDRSHQQLHIIRHDEDLGDRLAKIITMESLRV